MHIAALYNDVTLVVYIIQRGGDALQPNEAGISPIDIAKHLKHAVIERALVSSIYLQPNCLASPIKPAESHDIPILFELALPTDPHLSMDMTSSEQNCYTGSNLVYVMTDTDAQDSADPINPGSSKPCCWSPLMKAAYRGQFKIASWLIVENKAKVMDVRYNDSILTAVFYTPPKGKSGRSQRIHCSALGSPEWTRRDCSAAVQ